MDTSDVAKFVAMIASLLSIVNVTLSPENMELLTQLIIAVVTILPLALAMLKKDPKTGEQVKLKTGQAEKAAIYNGVQNP